MRILFSLPAAGNSGRHEGGEWMSRTRERSVTGGGWCWWPLALAALAVERGWVGIVVNGCIRDRSALGTLPLGVMALATIPVRSGQRGEGEIDVPVRFAGVTFQPGHHLYADADGIVVSAEPLDGEDH